MTKTLALIAAVLCLAAAARAEEFFGLTPEDMQGLVAQAKAQQRADDLKRLGQDRSVVVAPVGRAVGLIKTLDSRQDCIADAVTARMGVRPSYDAPWPDVLLGSETDEARYKAAVKAQSPAAPAPRGFQTIYLPDYNVIYLADAASAYKGGATMDAALAGEYARFLDYAQKGIRDGAALAADAAAVSAWYASTYPAGRSSCR